MSADPLDRFLGEAGQDPGCDAVFEQLDLYCDAVLHGVDVERQFPGVARHLRNCAACREEAEGLIQAVEHEGGTGK